MNKKGGTKAVIESTKVKEVSAQKEKEVRIGTFNVSSVWDVATLHHNAQTTGLW